MATQKVNIDISTKGAKKSKEELSGLNGAISKMGKAVGIASAAYFGAKGLINAFSEQEMAEKKLEVALGRTSQALLDQASALQKVSMFGDEQIIVQQAFLASLKFTEDQIKTIIPASIDLAAATGISLDSAVRNLSKTFSGLQGELGELVPQLRQLTTEQLQQGEAVKVVAELMRGQGKEQSETMTGSIQQMNMAVGDLAESMGEILAPTIIKVTRAMTSFIQAGQTDLISDQTSEQLENFIKTLEDQREEMRILMDQGISPARQAYLEYNKQIEEAKKKLEELNTVTQSNTTIFATETDILSLRNELLADGVLSIQDQIDISETHLESIKEQIRQNLNITNNKKKEIELEGKLVELRHKLADATDKSTGRMLSAFSKLNEEAKGSTKVSARLAQAAATIDMFAGMNKAFAQGGLFGFATSAAIFAAGMANIIEIENTMAKMEKFATGGDFITSGPQMIMVGDNPGGRERVQVTPLSSPNINGPQGVTINLRGNILGTREFVRDTLIPEIQKAVRYS